jgi:hypothetical protein
MWERLLTDVERQSLGGTQEVFEQQYMQHGTVGIWMKLKDVSFPRAVIELALGLGFIYDTDVRWLLREVGEEDSPATAASLDRPTWNAETGELCFKGSVIRKVRLTKKPTNIRMILDTFQEDDWPARIDSPLPGGSDQKKLHEAVHSLNSRLEAIRFHATEGGQAVLWTPLNSE